MASLETQAPRRLAGAPRAGLEINSKRLKRDGLLLQEGAGGYVCLGLGSGAGLARFAFEDAGETPFFERCRAATAALDGRDLAKAERLGLQEPVSQRADPALRRLAVADALLKAGFDPDQPRDDDGRWTDTGGGSGGTSGADTAGTAAGFAREGLAAARNAGSLLGRLAPPLLSALGRFATMVTAPIVAGPTALLGFVFIPFNRGLISDGSLPDQPDVNYHFDRGTGVLQLGRDGQEIFRGQADADGIFRTEDGEPIGRRFDDTIMVDPDALLEVEASKTRGKRPKAATGVGTAIGVDVESTTPKNEEAAQPSWDEPKLCPDKTTDRPGSDRSARAVAYQTYVSRLINPEDPLPPGFAVELWNPIEKKFVSFDECYHRTGVMVEVKGEGLEDMFQERNPYAWDHGVEKKFIGQVKRQINAAQGRPIEWHFANSEIAEHFRQIFAEHHLDISVIWTPPPPGLQ